MGTTFIIHLVTVIYVQLKGHSLPHKQVVNNASKNPLLRKCLYNLCICYMYERLYDYYNPFMPYAL